MSLFFFSVSLLNQVALIYFIKKRRRRRRSSPNLGDSLAKCSKNLSKKKQSQKFRWKILHRQLHTKQQQKLYIQWIESVAYSKWKFHCPHPTHRIALFLLPLFFSVHAISFPRNLEFWPFSNNTNIKFLTIFLINYMPSWNVH